MIEKGDCGAIGGIKVGILDEKKARTAVSTEQF
jgi:hypothetical protein